MLAEKLRLLRDIHDLTQNDLAEVIGVDRSTYAYYELGRIEPSLEKIRVLAIFYQVSADFLLDLPPIEYNQIQKRVETLLSYPPDAIYNTRIAYTAYLMRQKNKHHDPPVHIQQLQKEKLRKTEKTRDKK